MELNPCMDPSVFCFYLAYCMERENLQYESGIFQRGSEWGGGGGPLVGCRLKFSNFVGSWFKFSIFVGSRLNVSILVDRESSNS